MKRSELNRAIRDCIALVEGRGLSFPEFAKWTPDDWRKIGEDQREIVDNMLGWDVSDFGGNFAETGLLIFTFRNGNFNNKTLYPKPYAEKLLLVGDGQTLPFHFHWSKMEDIINRGGGDLEITVYNSLPDGELDRENDVHLTLDGRKVSVPAGGKVVLKPGASITLLPGQYHQWIGVPGTGPVMLFEVSSTNDDTVDNRFYSASSRIPEIEEDEAPEYLIFNDYKDYVKF
ncbi:MAG: D-lyxose/D-mannose family sugar isomerase [Oscillospiraceae bacterium]|nr:D-lyxose/D-mannose family sugar isomerase [Oscillospiraceae bacterium]MBQ3880418.1 D-lyxose/D-mannose family sugar isomerase [Oscillospiraceae bacterium]